jgi:hypothetical protein
MLLVASGQGIEHVVVFRATEQPEKRANPGGRNDVDPAGALAAACRYRSLHHRRCGTHTLQARSQGNAGQVVKGCQ